LGLPVGEPSIIGTLGIPIVGVVGAGGVKVDGGVGIVGELMLLMGKIGKIFHYHNL